MRLERSLTSEISKLSKTKGMRNIITSSEISNISKTTEIRKIRLINEMRTVVRPVR